MVSPTSSVGGQRPSGQALEGDRKEECRWGMSPVLLVMASAALFSSKAHASASPWHTLERDHTDQGFRDMKDQAEDASLCSHSRTVTRAHSRMR